MVGRRKLLDAARLGLGATRDRMIYLHIGRHKTGTTAIQQFLGSNRERLADQGVLYPRTAGPTWEEAHHAVWMALSARGGPIRQPFALPWLEPVDLEDFSRHVRDAPTAIVSSEALQGLDPFSLVDIFPPETTTVVVYLREQLDYLLTAYAQEVQSNLEIRSFAEFVEDDALDLQYGPFLDRWAEAFGRASLIVRLYDRTRLVGGSAVDDFMDAIGLHSLDGLIRVSDDVNVSLSAMLVTTKRLLNRVITPVQHEGLRLYEIFGYLAALDESRQRRVSVPPSKRRILRARHRGDNEYVSQRYLGAHQDMFRYVPVFERDLPLAGPEVAAMLSHLSEFTPRAHEILIQAAANEQLLNECPPDEQRLAERICLVLDGASV